MPASFQPPLTRARINTVVPDCSRPNSFALMNTSAATKSFSIVSVRNTLVCHAIKEATDGFRRLPLPHRDFAHSQIRPGEGQRRRQSFIEGRAEQFSRLVQLVLAE